MNIFDEPKIDCHAHVFDPAHFPYRADTHYRPAGQETGSTASQLTQVMDAYGVCGTLLVGPNSGYGVDNRCMLDAIANSGGRMKGIAVVANDITAAELAALKAADVVGVAWNATFHGVDYYTGPVATTLLARLAALDMFVDIQVEHAQLLTLMPMLADSGVRVLVDHCGRPTPGEGLTQPGFAALLALAATGRAFIKLSGLSKFSQQPSPHADARPYVDVLVDAYTPERCLWASDWPYLRAPGRIDYGVLLKAVERQFADAADRRSVLWQTPRALFGFTC